MAEELDQVFEELDLPDETLDVAGYDPSAEPMEDPGELADEVEDELVSEEELGVHLVEG